jgi:hypothetical protein
MKITIAILITITPTNLSKNAIVTEANEIAQPETTTRTTIIIVWRIFFYVYQTRRQSIFFHVFIN